MFTEECDRYKIFLLGIYTDFISYTFQIVHIKNKYGYETNWVD